MAVMVVERAAQVTVVATVAAIRAAVMAVAMRVALQRRWHCSSVLD
jgi:hypothetical protein